MCAYLMGYIAYIAYIPLNRRVYMGYSAHHHHHHLALLRKSGKFDKNKILSFFFLNLKKIIFN